MFIKITFLKNKIVFVWLLLAFISMVGFFPLKERFFAYNSKNDVQKKLNELVEKDTLYINEDQLLGASTDNKVYSVLSTISGDFLLAQIVKAKVISSEFEGSVTFRLPNGDLYTTTSSAYVPEIILRDGTKTEAQIVKGAISTIGLKNGNYLSVRTVGYRAYFQVELPIQVIK